ncbi:hypothetical protein SeLEV6574_g01951 [Synchytrium endobioticum]|uniref:Hyaluronan/mRNA-binding protein domain-containing protein n=1 Tax=Synchytrium endobioticum TaxID=286115 RepID=A0A507DBA7_9FUNG|nr:hypothetical protein SeLEV6574_g01951 [Synchytrium endobioticum]
MDVKSRNPFELLGDDDSDAPAAVVASKSLNKSASKTSPPPQTSGAQSKNTAALDKSRATPGENSSRSRTEYPRRGAANAGRGARAGADLDGQPRDRPPRFSGSRSGDSTNGIVSEDGGIRPSRERRSDNWDGPSADSQNDGGRGRGSYRGRPAGRGREYDRRSGRVDMDSEKKEVAGKGSWGDPVTSETGGEHVEGLPAEDALATAKIDSSDLERAEGGATPDEGAATAAEPKEQSPEDKFKSLEDYLKEQAEKKAATAAAASRKANEGADTSQWKDTVEFKRCDDEDVFIALGQTKSKKTAGAAAKEKVQVDLNITFNEGAARRGGRGDFRGGRGRGVDRGERAAALGGGGGGKGRAGPQVQLNDTNAFPSLGSA